MFLKRFCTSFLFNLKLWKSVFDWTITLYLLVPGSIISYFLLRDYLQDATLLVVSPTILTVLFFVISFLLTKTTLRLFLYEADVLFYKQQHRKIQRLKLAAYSYSFMTYNAALLLVLFIGSLFVEMPLLVMLLLLNVLSICQICISYRDIAWYIRLPLLTALHGIASILLLVIPWWCLLIVLVLEHAYLLKRTLSNRYWTTEVNWEYEAFYKWMKLLYQLNKEMRQYLPAKDKKPFLLMAKQTTLSKYRLDNLVYKTLLRKLQYLSLTFRLIAVCIGLLLLLPTWAKVLVLLITIMGLFTALDAILKDIRQAPFFKLVAVSDEDWIHTKLRLQKRLVYPIGALLIGLSLFI